eukprot:13996575-Ditylum_brightwellii.AAC.1
MEFIKEKYTSVAVAVSRLDYSFESLHNDANLYVNEPFLQDEDDLALFPMSPKFIAEVQENCTVLKKQLKEEQNKKRNNIRTNHQTNYDVA